MPTIERERPGTAESLLDLYADTSVVRHDIGAISATVGPLSLRMFLNAPSPRGPQSLHIHGAADTGLPTVVRVPLHEGLDGLAVLTEGSADAANVLAAAIEATQLFDDFVGLPVEERRRLSSMPRGNATAYDWLRTDSEMAGVLTSLGSDSGVLAEAPMAFDAFQAAKQVLLS